MSPHQHVNQDSGKTEYYTDPRITASARAVLGVIDLDPASSHVANRFVQARRFFTADEDGLKQEWSGKIWMNHPFSKGQNGRWIKKLVDAFKTGAVNEAICICYASTSERWFQPLIQYPQCFPSPRTNYFLPDGTKKNGVTKGSVITYLGSNFAKFKSEFEIHGTIKIVG